MDEIKLSNEGFTPGKRRIRLGKLKRKPILLEVGKQVSVKLNMVSDPIDLYVDEICLSNEYPTIQVDVRFIDTKHISKYYIKHDGRNIYE